MTARTASTDQSPTLETSAGAATWRALGTYVDVRTTPDAVRAAADIAVDVLAQVDAACSRFRQDSDLTRANQASGTTVPVSPVLAAAVRVALEAAEDTAGIVDPLLGEVLRAAGYDRSFELVPAQIPDPAALPRARGRWQDVEVGESHLRVPPGSALDLGATGKAFAADLVALTIADALEVPVLVSLGGDVRVASPGDGPGLPDEHPGYTVILGHTVADLASGGPSARVSLTRGGLATSSTAARHWRRAGLTWHHLVDPRTGEPATGPWRTVTALGHTAAAANTASTAAIVLGDTALTWLCERGVAARLVDHEGRVTRTPAWTASDLEETP
ncbi:MAG TPA: FAD:protein FMN transferase [Ornithinibacter sp.]|jgi:thiamine biosynthesis lipoprotein|uniref:FAD:protein FMN transferase n=1 Tax=Ornithinibacter sp. TaxID=2862748 RepID=UPI001B6C0207|nr:FAD:protein FMN transferase [Ornithinibacter sp.]MBP6524753.1 FAD:protein FMN transferase [Dermatophilaceae bacterium]HQV83597.1 FAD:protein FMN transferase [Ornithinibacter sp.]HQX87203.1 FAD:protein FMN transferase [Ornithinibacter sp.]HRA26969.1 FAD:protein FMN transferase [Ornithinibacter sp.]